MTSGSGGKPRSVSQAAADSAVAEVGDDWLRAAGERLRIPSPGWRDRSACSSADNALFVGDLSPDQEARAKAICEWCLVQDACLAFSITHGVQYGIWGGLNDTERQKVRQIWTDHRALGVASQQQQQQTA